MARYNDVDLLIFEKWEEVRALREAFASLIERIDEMVGATLQQVSTHLSARHFNTEQSSSQPYLSFWKPEWENRKAEPGVFLTITDFIPTDCRKSTRNNPLLWCETGDFAKLRLRETPDEFGRALRGALPADLLTKWGHGAANLSRYPLVCECDVTDAARVAMVATPQQLADFLLDRVEDFAEIIPAIDQTLQKMTRR